MKKPVLVDFKIYNEKKRIQFSQLPADEKARLENISHQAKKFLQENDCRIHGDRYQSLLISVVDGAVEIQAQACCAEYAKDIRQLEWENISDSFSAVNPGIGGGLYSA